MNIADKLKKLWLDEENIVAILHFPGMNRDQTICRQIWQDGDPIPVPRFAKTAAEQKRCTKERAEVFTPPWIVDKMVNYIPDVIEPNKTVLEITCGEGAFLTTRYHPDTGEYIPPDERVGILDRRLKRINEQHRGTPAGWWDQALDALETVYGYDIDLNNVLLTRANLFLTTMEFHAQWCDPAVPLLYTDSAAEIISRNIFQMDGLTGTIPGTDVKPLKLESTTRE